MRNQQTVNSILPMHLYRNIQYIALFHSSSNLYKRRSVRSLCNISDIKSLENVTLSLSTLADLLQSLYVNLSVRIICWFSISRMLADSISGKIHYEKPGKNRSHSIRYHRNIWYKYTKIRIHQRIFLDRIK